jgi:hypothetical protein
VDVWIRDKDRYGTETLTRHLHIGEGAQHDQPLTISLTGTAGSLLAWVAENDRALLVDDIPASATALRDRLSGEIITGRYIDVYSRTRSFAAVPITYRSQRAILSIEAGYAQSLKDYHIESMRALAVPIVYLIWKASAFKANNSQTSEAIENFVRANSRPVSNLNPYKSGFIARSFDKAFDQIEHTITAVLQNEGVRAKAYQHPPGGGLIMDELLKQIRSSHFGIVDISELNLNVLIEFGVMLGTEKPILILRREGSAPKLPFELGNYQCHEYRVEGSSVLVRNTTSVVPIQEILGDFIRSRLANNRSFREAKDWEG